MQVFSGGDDVAVFRRAARTLVFRHAEVAAIADASAEVDRQHHVTLVGQVLVHRVGKRVILAAVVVTQQHLANWAAVHEDQGRAVIACFCVFRQKQLAVNVHAIGRLEHHLLRLDHFPGRVVIGQRTWEYLGWVPSVTLHNRDAGRVTRARFPKRDLAAVAHGHRVGLDGTTAGEVFRRSAAGVVFPQVTAVNVLRAASIAVA